MRIVNLPHFRMVNIGRRALVNPRPRFAVPGHHFQDQESRVDSSPAMSRSTSAPDV